MRISSPFALALALATTSLVPGCGGGEDAEDDFLACVDKCDSVGPLTVARRWVPVQGFLRVVVDGEHDVVVTPSEGVKIEANGNRYTLTFGAPGYYDIAAGAGQLKVRVSDDGPVFNVASPAAGAFAALGRLGLQGSVTDPLGQPLRLEAGGREIALDASGAFRGDLEPTFGVNFVELTAIDVAGNRFVYSHGYLAAPRFGGGENLTSVAVAEELLDLIAAKISPLIPSIVVVGPVAEPIADPLAHRIFFDGATLPGQNGNPGSITVSLDSLQGAVRTTLSTEGDLVARAHVDNWILSDTQIVATASDLFVDASASFSGNGLTAVVDELTIDFSNFDLQIGSIPGWIPGLFVEASKGILGRVIKGRVGPLVGQALGSVDGDFQLDLVLGCLELQTPFTLSYRLDAITPATGRLGVRLGAEAHHDGAAGPGAPALAEQGVAAPAGGPMAVGVGYNLLNQFLYELWHAGALEITLDEGDLADVLPKVPGLGGLDVVINVKAALSMPPVVERGANGDVLFSFGELRLDIMLDLGVFQLSIAANVGARTDVALTIEDGAVRVTPTVRELHLDLGRRAFSGLNPEAVEALVRAIAPELVGRIAGSLEAFRLPEFDLENAGLPGVRLGIESGSVDAAAAGVTFTGSVAVITDVPPPTTGPGCPSRL